MPPVIQRLAEKLIAERGYSYYTDYQALKLYVSKLSDDEFAEQIARVDNPDIFRQLFAVGLSAERQSIVRLKWKELK